MKKLSLLFASYTLLSWILFFRDERALAVLSTRFYPNLARFLADARLWFLAAKLNTIPTVLFAFFLVAAFVIYFRLIAKPVATRTAVIFAILFQIIVFFSYPILSTDVLSYILSDRISVVYHQSVWTTRPDEFKSDPYFGLSDWTDKTRIYGGVNQAVYSVAGQFSGDDFLTNLASHKLVVVFFALATLAVVAKISPAFVPVIFANPLFVLETAGSGHNDILMLFFVVLTAWVYQLKKPLFVGLFLALATQVKVTPFLLAIFLAARYFADQKFAALLKFGLAYAGVVGSIYYLMGVNPLYSVVRTTGSIDVFWQSLALLIDRLAPIVKPVLSFGLLIFLGWQVLKTLIFRLSPITVYAQTFLVYLLFFLAAFWNWYPIWLLVLLPFITGNFLRKSILAVTFSSMFAYVVYWVALRANYTWTGWQVIMYLTILSGPLVAVIHEKFLAKAKG